MEILSRLRHLIDRRRARRRRTAICTIASPAYLPHAACLGASLARHAPGTPVHVLIADRDAPQWHRKLGWGELVTVETVCTATEWRRLAKRYSVGELLMALKPRLIRHLLAQGVERVVYIDADIELYDGLDALFVALERHPVALVPHVLSPPPTDGALPMDTTLLRSGLFNLGLVAAAAGEATGRFLDWWISRTDEFSYFAPYLGYLGDQRWVDYSVTAFPGFAHVRNPEVDVAYWNLYERVLGEREGRIHVGNAPLQSFHFSGFDLDDPARVSKYQNRVRAETGSVLAALLASYGECLRLNALALGVESGREPEGTLPPTEWHPAAALSPSGGPLSVAEELLATERYRVAIDLDPDGMTLDVLQRREVKIMLRNVGSETLPVGRDAHGRFGIALVWAYCDESRRALEAFKERLFLPRDLAPGEHCVIDFEVCAPHVTGNFLLEFNLVHEHVVWLKERGNPSAYLRVAVGVLPHVNERMGGPIS